MWTTLNVQLTSVENCFLKVNKIFQVLLEFRLGDLVRFFVKILLPSFLITCFSQICLMSMHSENRKKWSEEIVSAVMSERNLQISSVWGTKTYLSTIRRFVISVEWLFFFFFLKVGQPQPLIHLVSSFCAGNYFSFLPDSNSDLRSRKKGCWPLDHYHGPSVECLSTKMIVVGSVVLWVNYLNAGAVPFGLSKKIVKFQTVGGQC